MNLREAISEYVVGYLRWHEVIGMVRRQRIDDGDGVERTRRQAGEAGERLDCAVKVAEAAMAIVEQQEAVDNYAFADVVVGRGELWEQYRAARAKAGEVNREST